MEDFYHTEARLQPLGLAYLKATVLSRLPGVEVIIRDFHHRRGRRTIALPAELRYLRSYYPQSGGSPLRTFNHFYHFGSSYEEIARAVEVEKPDLVGISSLFSAYYREVLDTAAAIQARRPVPIVVGGAHATAVPESLLVHPSIEMVIRGAGERPLVELLRNWGGAGHLQSVPNLCYKLNGIVVRNRMGENYPLEELPVPDFSDWQPGHYCLDGQPLAMIATSRGCPQQCRFCAVHRIWGPQVERRGAEDVFQEILLRYREGYRVIDFEDDHFGGDKAETKALCQRIADFFPAGEICLTAMNGISYWHLDQELLAMMWRAGFRSLNLSLVSSDDRVGEAQRRPPFLKSFQNCVEDAHRLGFRITAYPILGLPGESMHSMRQTLIFLSRLPVRIGPSPFYPVPGSPLYDNQPGFTGAELVRARLTAFSQETSDCSRDQLYTLFLTARILNFLKGLVIPAAELSLGVLFKEWKSESAKDSLGWELLQLLLREGILYVPASKRRHRLEHFQAELFFHIWRSLDYIQTIKGQKLRVN